jgi:hypothetical protein
VLLVYFAGNPAKLSTFELPAISRSSDRTAGAIFAHIHTLSLEISDAAKARIDRPEGDLKFLPEHNRP